MAEELRTPKRARNPESDDFPEFEPQTEVKVLEKIYDISDPGIVAGPVRKLRGRPPRRGQHDEKVLPGQHTVPI